MSTTSINFLYIFEAPGTAYKSLQKLTSFNNATHNKIIKKSLVSYMFSIISPFEYQIVDCRKSSDTLSQCLYGCIGYCWRMLNN